MTHRAEAFHPAVGAGALHADVFPFAVRAGGALHAAVFPLAVRAGGANSAVAFLLPVGAGLAVHAPVFQLAVRAGVVVHAVVLSLAMRAPLMSGHFSPPRALMSAFRAPRRAKTGVVALRGRPREKL